MKVKDVVIKSGILDSTSKIIRAIQQKGLKINNVVPDSINEEIEIGDFLNGAWIKGMRELWEEQQTKQILCIKFGKLGKIVKIINDDVIVLT